jgi:hypothetical protein
MILLSGTKDTWGRGGDVDSTEHWKGLPPSEAADAYGPWAKGNMQISDKQRGLFERQTRHGKHVQEFEDRENQLLGT